MGANPAAFGLPPGFWRHRSRVDCAPRQLILSCNVPQSIQFPRTWSARTRERVDAGLFVQGRRLALDAVLVGTVAPLDQVRLRLQRLHVQAGLHLRTRAQSAIENKNHQTQPEGLGRAEAPLGSVPPAGKSSGATRLEFGLCLVPIPAGHRSWQGLPDACVFGNCSRVRHLDLGEGEGGQLHQSCQRND